MNKYATIIIENYSIVALRIELPPFCIFNFELITFYSMHSLIITAHPSSHGFTHAIARRYAEARTKLGHTSEILDLYMAE